MNYARTADGHEIKRNQTYYYLTNTSIKKTRCYSDGLNVCLEKIGHVYTPLSGRSTTIYKSGAKATAALAAVYEARLAELEQAAKRIPIVKGQITKIKKYGAVSPA